MARRKRSKWLVFGVPALLVLIAVIVVVSLSGSDDDMTVVQADLAYIDDISEIVTASGRIQPQTKVDIVAEVSAQIIDLYVKEGDRVASGSSLLLLDTIQLQANVAQARFSLDEKTARSAAAHTRYEETKLEYERQSQLHTQQLTSETVYTTAKFAYENAEANFRAMQAQVNTARARLLQAKDYLTKTMIVAPMDGAITYLNAEVGEIAPGQTAYTQGRTLMTISDLSVFEVEVEVDETEIAKLALDHEAKIRVDAFRDTSFAGEVVEIGNSAIVQGQGTENYSTNFRVKVRFNDIEPAIRPGMSASVDITTAVTEDAVLIPYASVVTREFDADSLKAAQDSLAQGDSAGVGLQAAELEEDTPASPTDSLAADSTTAGQKKKKEKTKISGVFLVQNGRAKFIEVSTGIADDRNIVALEGVAEGDTVISGSFQTLRSLADGDAVKLDQRSLDKIQEEAE